MKRRVIVTAVGFFVALAPAWANCNQAGNLIGSNCNFDVAGDVSNWTVVNADSCVHNAADGSSGVGNMECNAVSSSGNFVVRVNFCMTSGVAASTNYGYGADARFVSTAGTVPTCTVEASDWSGANCSTNINGATTPLAPGVTYTQSTAASYATGGTATTARVELFCISANVGAGDFVVRFDDAFFGVGLTPVELQQFSVE